MSARRLPSPLLAVTDRHGSIPLVETVRAVLASGCGWVWFRDRDLATHERRRLAEAVLKAVREAGGRLILGGDPELATALGADGVHLPGGTAAEAIAAARRSLGPLCWIGVSAHSSKEVATAAGAGADYATLSPVFPTASKPGYGPALGPAAIADAARFGIPIVALGGVTPENAAACRAAGAAGIAVMGGLMRAVDPGAAARRLRAAWDRQPDGAPRPSAQASKTSP